MPRPLHQDFSTRWHHEYLSIRTSTPRTCRQCFSTETPAPKPQHQTSLQDLATYVSAPRSHHLDLSSITTAPWHCEKKVGKYIHLTLICIKLDVIVVKYWSLQDLSTKTSAPRHQNQDFRNKTSAPKPSSTKTSAPKPQNLDISTKILTPQPF